MVFEIPEDVNVFDLIAIAVIEQAARDTHDSDPDLAKEAQSWLEAEGRTWWEIMGLEVKMFEKLILK